MNKMSIHTICVGAIQTNCYIVKNEETNEAVLFDPGDEADKILHAIERLNVDLVAILLTHGHFDHIMAATKVSAQTKAKIFVYEGEQDLLHDKNKNCGNMFGFHVDEIECEVVKDREELNLAGMEITVIHTPGHTSGSVCYYIEKEQILISGDTLFYHSVGRCDFPTGNTRSLQESIKERLFCLPKDVIVYPGHGTKTSIGHEMQNNPCIEGI